MFIDGQIVLINALLLLAILHASHKTSNITQADVFIDRDGRSIFCYKILYGISHVL